MRESEIAVVVGVGPGLAEPLALRFAEAGMSVAAVSRKGLAPNWGGDRGRIRGYAADATDAGQVRTTFAALPPSSAHRISSCSMSGPGIARPFSTSPTNSSSAPGAPAALRDSWLAEPPPRGGGTIIFTGATASVRGASGFAAFAVPKFGLRALAQSMAREFAPKGIHVAHVIIDGMIDNAGQPDSSTMMGPSAIAESYYALHCQPSSAWTHEIDLRPARENF